MSADEQPSHSLLLETHVFPASPSSTPSSSRDPSLSIPSSELHTVRSLPSLSTQNTSGSNASVKFAPLPVLEKRSRSRHPSFQYGVGARSRILRNRRLMQEMEAAAEQGETIYVAEGDKVVSTGGREEDPVVVLGKKMVDASKNLWRRVAGKPGMIPVANGQIQGSGDNVEGTTVILRSSTEDQTPDSEEKEEEGRVWEEVVDPELYKRLSIIRPEEPEITGDGATGEEVPVKKAQVQALGKRNTLKRKEIRRAATS